MNYSKICSIIIAVFSVFLLASCDPGQSIRIENQTNKTANIQFVFQGEDRQYQFEDLTNGDTLAIRLEPVGQNATKEFHFGIGHWKVEYSMDKLVEMVASVTIETATSKEIFSGKEQIRSFFEKRITGSRDEIILITLN